MKLLRRMLLGLSLLLCAVALLLAWLVHTESGTRALVRFAAGALGDTLTVQDVHGTLAREVRFESLRYRDPAAAIDLRLDRGKLTVTTGALLRGRLRVASAALDGVVLDLLGTPPASAGPAPRSPMQLPIAIELDGLTLERVELRTGGTTALTLDRIELAGSWTERGIEVRRLAVAAAQGNASVSGRLDDVHAYAGAAEGSFEWRLGDRLYRGTLNAGGDGRSATVRTELSAPTAATVVTEITPGAATEWRITVDVPAFDPRAGLLPGSTIASMGLTLQGHGDRDSAETQATITIDGEALHVQDARVRLDHDVLRVDALALRLGDEPGTVHATGMLALHESPLRGAADLDWSDVKVPAKWVGQELLTHGRATMAGTATQFDSTGEMTIGPTGRAADVSWSVSGSPAAFEVRRFEATEKAGRLTATGNVGLVPHPSWQLDAQASRFDPGAFVAGWPGSLDFALVTQGTLDPDARSMTLRLSELSGRLRGLPVTGDGELALTPDMRLAGTLALRSGDGSLRIVGKRGESLDVTADLDVASLSQWHPDFAGRLRAHAHATGRWPELRIEGSAEGADLAAGGGRVGDVKLDISVRNAKRLDGELRLEAHDAAIRGFAFDDVQLEASGSDARHVVSLRAQGQPLSTALELRGAYARGTWSGTLQEWSLDVEQVPPLRLQAPVQATFGAKTFDVSEICVAGVDVGLCASGRRERNGAIEAQYAIQHLPLALLARLAIPDRRIAVAGTIEGGGSLRRNADGRYSGAGRLSSAAGHVAQSDDVSAVKLDYEDLALDSSFEGDAARIGLRARLPAQGELSGELALTNLRSRDPSLAGSAGAALRDLSPLTLMLPQLANVHGAGEVSCEIDGTLRDPRFTGTLRVSGFDGELPLLGLQLKEGSVMADARSGAGVTISGAISSGDGRIELSGSGAAAGTLEVGATGHDFLAANVPAARIVISPELALEGRSDALALTGRILIPSASVDLDQLTAVGRERVSPDVVVVDREATEERKAIELRTDVTVVLGGDVKLVGLGLDAEAEGELRIRETPGEPGIAAGEIRLEGTYEAYGRQLEIERGRLQYASAPLDDPQLDVLAVRKLRDVTAKLRVTGTAKRPELTVFAEPAMSSTEALSYLINGKPPDELRSDENARVQSAAQGLGTIVLGNRLTKNLGARFGADVGVQQNAELGSAFTVGTYLSPRFYVSYGVGLFEPGQVMTLRYELTDRLSLEANQAPEDQHAGIFYKLER